MFCNFVQKPLVDPKAWVSEDKKLKEKNCTQEAISASQIHFGLIEKIQQISKPDKKNYNGACM